MERLRRRDQLALPLDPVLVAEARAAQVDAAQVHGEHVVEDGHGAIVDADADGERLDPLLPDRAISAGVVGEVGDARDLEPDDVGRVVRDPLRVRLGEADADIVGVVESLRHVATIREAARGDMTDPCPTR